MEIAVKMPAVAILVGRATLAMSWTSGLRRLKKRFCRERIKGGSLLGEPASSLRTESIICLQRRWPSIVVLTATLTTALWCTQQHTNPKDHSSAIKLLFQTNLTTQLLCALQTALGCSITLVAARTSGNASLAARTTRLLLVPKVK